MRQNLILNRRYLQGDHGSQLTARGLPLTFLPWAITPTASTSSYRSLNGKGRKADSQDSGAVAGIAPSPPDCLHRGGGPGGLGYSAPGLICYFDWRTTPGRQNIPHPAVVDIHNRNAGGAGVQHCEQGSDAPGSPRSPCCGHGHRAGDQPPLRLPAPSRPGDGHMAFEARISTWARRRRPATPHQSLSTTHPIYSVRPPPHGYAAARGYYRQPRNPGEARPFLSAAFSWKTASGRCF